MNTRSVASWAEAYARAWELGDADAAAGLFIPDATYRSLIFNEPHTGSAAIRAYWQRVTSTEATCGCGWALPWLTASAPRSSGGRS